MNSNQDHDTDTGLSELEALKAIDEMERAAIHRTTPPSWFRLVLSLLSGALVSLSAAGLRQYHVIIIVFMALVIVYQVQKTGASVRQFPSKLIIGALFALLVLFFLLVMASQLLEIQYGVSWAPVVAGLLMAGVVFGLSMAEKRWHSRISEGNDD